MERLRQGTQDILYPKTLKEQLSQNFHIQNRFDFDQKRTLKETLYMSLGNVTQLDSISFIK